MQFDDQWYPGKIVKHDRAAGRYHVAFHDGELVDDVELKEMRHGAGSTEEPALAELVALYPDLVVYPDPTIEVPPRRPVIYPPPLTRTAVVVVPT